MTAIVDITETQTKSTNLASTSKTFLDYLDGWLEALPTLDLRDFMQAQHIKPENIAVISVDLVVGFCYEGALASPRIANVIEPSAQALKLAHSLGLRDFALVQEHHTHDAVEFEQFGPHCIRGTDEAQTVDTLASLPFSDLFSLIHKNSIHPAHDTSMDHWLAQRPQLNSFITVGDCTDLCLYQSAMHLKLGANARDKRVNVIVPADCVQTYDLPVEIAGPIGAMPHEGDLMHAVFLYHMALNGMQVVAGIR